MGWTTFSGVFESASTFLIFLDFLEIYYYSPFLAPWAFSMSFSSIYYFLEGLFCWVASLLATAGF
jgi:hypothetical protein